MAGSLIRRVEMRWFHNHALLGLLVFLIFILLIAPNIIALIGIICIIRAIKNGVTAEIYDNRLVYEIRKKKFEIFYFRIIGVFKLENGLLLKVKKNVEYLSDIEREELYSRVGNSLEKYTSDYTEEIFIPDKDLKYMYREFVEMLEERWSIFILSHYRTLDELEKSIYIDKRISMDWSSDILEIEEYKKSFQCHLNIFRIWKYRMVWKI